MPILPNEDRVRIWNAFLSRTWCEAQSLAKRMGKSPTLADFHPKLILGEEAQSRLALLAFCTLAIEARANHHIDELVERGRLTENEAAVLQRLSADAKWFLLPKLAGSRKRFDRDKPPHQAVAEICGKRNILFHVNFRRLSEGLPNAGKLLSLFRDFVAAMEDMNVVLKRVRRPRRRVLEIGRFS
jgi:hypothetical protein